MYHLYGTLISYKILLEQLPDDLMMCAITYNFLLTFMYRCSVLKPDEFKIEMSELVFGLCPSVKLDVFFPGFPTLKHIEHEVGIRSFL